MRPFVLLALLATASVQAQPAYDFSAVDALLTDSIDALGGGASLLVRVDGEVVYRRGFGAFAADEVLPTASAAKWYSAGVIASLLADNTMTLDDSLAMFFPNLTGEKRAITIRQAFSHTSGLRRQHPCLGNAGLSMAFCVGIILLEPQDYAPGTAFSYGGNSMQVAGRAAEIATGEAWVDLFSQRVAVPLGLTNTGYESQTNPRVPGQMFTTVDDYGRYLQMLLNGGTLDGTEVLPPWAVAEILADQTDGATIEFSPYQQYIWRFPFLPPLDSIRYGLGVWRESVGADGRLRIGNSHGAVGASPWIDPGRNLAGVLLVDDELPEIIGTFYKMRGLIEAAVDAGPVSAEDGPGVGAALRIGAVWPNPARGSASVTIELAEPGAVRIDVIDALGRVVATPVDGWRGAGPHAVALDLGGLAPGVYLVVAGCGNERAERRISVLR